MKKYKVKASYVVHCEAEIEAETQDEAYAIARDMDGGSFTPSNENYDWHINDIEEIK